MAGTVSYSGLVNDTPLATTGWLTWLDTANLAQSPQGSVVKVSIPNFFATIPSPVTTTGRVTGVGVTYGSGTLLGTGDIAISTNKFTVVGASGNTSIAGTLGVGGTANVVGDFSVASTKFTVDAGSGDTEIAGSLTVTGNTVGTGFRWNPTATLDRFEQLGAQLAAQYGATYQPIFALYRANGTIASPTRALSGDSLGSLLMGGFENSGNSYFNGGGVTAVATENYGANRGTKLQFITTLTGAAAAAVRWEIDGTGALIPETNNASDLGSTSFRVRAGYFGTSLNSAGTLSSTGDFSVNTSMFTVAASTGNTAVAGTLNVTGATTAGTYNGQTISSTASFTGTVNVTGNFTVNTTQFTVNASTGATVGGTYNGQTITSSANFTGTVNTVGNLTVATNKLTVTASTGAVRAASDIRSDTKFNTNGVDGISGLFSGITSITVNGGIITAIT